MSLELVDALKNGGIAVVRTDTLYGIIALASNKNAVEKVYTAKNRDPSKQCIILISDSPVNSDYSSLITRYSKQANRPTSVVVPATNEPEWLLRGGDTIAYRVVKEPYLASIIDEVGPVIAPSANPEGLAPAHTIEQAKEYFGDRVDVYVDGGVVPDDVQASEIIKVNTDTSIVAVRSQFNEIVPGMPSEVRIHRSSGGVIIKDDKVLLIHWDEPRNSYDFPKGTIEPGESSEAACVREVFEETGYKTKIIAFIGSNEFDFQTPEGEWKHKINDYYLLELADEHLFEAAREPHETFENVWIPIDEAASIITRDINIEIFHKAVQLKNSVSGGHDNESAK